MIVNEPNTAATGMGDFQDKAMAWDAVCNTLDQCVPGWSNDGRKSGLGPAVATIKALAAQPAPGVGGRVDASEALQSLADYFRRTGDLWEGPDGCAERGTVLCDEIRDRLEKLAREPMALGLTKIPLFPALAPTRPAESVAQGGEDLQALADAVSITNATGNESLFIPAVQNLVDAVRKLRPTPATGSGGEAA